MLEFIKTEQQFRDWMGSILLTNTYFWLKRIFGCDADLNYCSAKGARCVNCYLPSYLKPKDFTHVRFRYGYTKRTMTYEINDISIGVCNPKWGAPDCKVIIIKIGRLCDTKK